MMGNWISSICLDSWNQAHQLEFTLLLQGCPCKLGLIFFFLFKLLLKLSRLWNFLFFLVSMPSHRQSTKFWRTYKAKGGVSQKPSLCCGSLNIVVVSLVFSCQQLLWKIRLFCLVDQAYLPDPLTGHISGICPKAQQRPVSQQHSILVYWPFSSPAQRPLARAE